MKKKAKPIFTIKVPLGIYVNLKPLEWMGMRKDLERCLKGKFTVLIMGISIETKELRFNCVGIKKVKKEYIENMMEFIASKVGGTIKLKA